MDTLIFFDNTDMLSWYLKCIILFMPLDLTVCFNVLVWTVILQNISHELKFVPNCGLNLTVDSIELIGG